VIASSRDLRDKFAAVAFYLKVIGMTITSIKLSKRRSNEVEVFLDGKKELQVLKSIAQELRLGQVLTSEEISELKSRDHQERLFQKAVGLINRRPRSEGELRDRFTRKNILPDIQDQVIERLYASRLLDDLAFAQAWIENRQTFRPRSSWALTYELRRKGVADPIIEQALSDFDEVLAVNNAAQHGARKYRNLSKETFRKRLSAYLNRRGFRYNQFSPVVDKMWSEITGVNNESEEIK
jgi:regulatory protein